MSNSAVGSLGDVNGSSPIQTIPPELLCEIFHHCISLPNDPYGRPSVPRPSVKEAPLKLGRICRYWRKMALSSPSLWCRLSLRRETNERNLSLDLQIMDEWLARSKRAPLWLSVNYSAMEYGSALHEIGGVLYHYDRRFTTF
ncbi:hypothetical protein BD410DRAFT_390996 [Rickenella mellea]|uniref:Uncharacterized protein n=1 Tax=Rickenella mellea TaxID=50990 RepID=A0A4Y7PYV1_9AGAM|nr:hypothetical protein BD410DRAFT_390996 [Rickenella mellea]